MDNYQRGDIYYVEPYYSVGSEQRSGRPAIIVSNNRNNESSPTVEVVYMTTQPKKDLPTHVTVHGTGKESTALCEQVHTVDLQRLTSYCGVCSKMEMQQIDVALMVSLDLPTDTEVKEVIKEVPADTSELVAVKAQLEIVQQMYNNLLREYMAAKLG